MFGISIGYSLGNGLILAHEEIVGKISEEWVPRGGAKC